MTDLAPILQVIDVVKDFGGVRAVNHCSLHVMPGTITGLIDPNGAGKTTLFNLVSGALTPTSGQIILNGRRIGGTHPWRCLKRPTWWPVMERRRSGTASP